MRRSASLGFHRTIKEGGYDFVALNGKQLKWMSIPQTPLLWVLRDSLGLTGTKFGAVWHSAEPAPCT